jgi:fumarylacetoacetase
MCLKSVLPHVNGKPMRYLEDGDRLTIEGWFQTEDGEQAGFGPLTSMVLASQ